MKVRKRLVALTMLTTLVFSAFSPIIYALDVSDEITEATQAESSEDTEVGAEDAPAVSEETNIPELTTTPEASETPEVSEPAQAPVTPQSIAIGEDTVTEVVKKTIDLSFYDLLGGYSETFGNDEMRKCKAIPTSDNKGKIYLSRYFWFTGYENSDKAVHEQLSHSTIYLYFTDVNSEQADNVVAFDKSSFYIYDFSQNISETFTSYLKDGDNLIEYQITLNYRGEKQTVDKTFAPTFSQAMNSQKQTSSDGYLSFTVDYANRQFTIDSEKTDWLVFRNYYGEVDTASLTGQTVYLEQAKASYQYYLYNPKTNAVKIYQLTVTNTITEEPEETVTINLNKNNQWQAGTEVYQNGMTNQAFQVVGGYESNSSRFRLDWQGNEANVWGDSGTFYFGLSGQNQAKTSFVEYAVWQDSASEDHLIKIVTNLDETMAETVQPKTFEHQLIKANLTDEIVKVESKYNDNRTVTEYITYDATGKYTDYSDKSTQGQYILLRADSTIEGIYDFYEYLTEVEENTYEKWYYHSDEGVQRYHITGDDLKETEIINISAELDNFETITTESEDQKLTFSTNHRGNSQSFSNYYYLNYDYEYDGIYEYQADDWQYGVADEGDDTINLTQKIYQIRYHKNNNDYSTHKTIEKVYTVNYTLEARAYVQKAAIDISVSQANNYDYFEYTVVKSVDDALTLRGYYYGYDSDSEGSSYRYHDDSYCVQLDSEALGENLIVSNDLPYKSITKKYTDDVLTNQYVNGHDTGAVYVYDTKAQTYAKYPVNLTVDETRVEPSTLTPKTINITGQLSQMLTTSQGGYWSLDGETVTYQDAKAGSVNFFLYCDKYNLRGEYDETTPVFDRLFLNYDKTTTKADNIYTFQYRAGVKVAVTVANDLATNPEVMVSKLSAKEKTITVAKGNWNWWVFSQNISVSPEDATVKYVKFEVADKTVLDDTSFQAIKSGATEVTATAVNGKKTTFTVVVKNQVNESYNPVAEVTDSGEGGTGIKVAADSENVLPSGASLAVTPILTTEVADDVLSAVDTLTAGQFKLFDIKLVNQDNQGESQNVQPNGQVTVYIPIPDDFDKDKLIIYHFDEKTKTRTKISGWVETIDAKDYFAFYTDHFSYYILEEQVAGDDDDEPTTSDSSSSSTSSSEPVTSEPNSSSSSSSEPVTSESNSSSSSSSEPVISESNSSSSSSSEPVTSKPSSEEPTTSETILINSKTGVKVVGDIPVGALLEATVLKDFNNPNYLAVDKLLESRFELFEIHLQKDGAVVQPNGNIKVYLPIPAGFDSSKLKLYYFNEQTNQLALINGFVEGDFYVFETNHFSYYVLEETKNKVAPQKQLTNNLPDTGSKSTVSIEIYGSLIVLLVLAFVSLKTKKS